MTSGSRPLTAREVADAIVREWSGEQTYDDTAADHRSLCEAIEHALLAEREWCAQQTEWGFHKSASTENRVVRKVIAERIRGTAA